LTSAIDSMFMLSIWPLLPVSIAEMPSIMMLFWLTPPTRVPMPAFWLPPLLPGLMTTPGTNPVTAAKLPWLSGRFSICAVEIANERSPLDA
jgi:hypothetical protein